MSSAVEILEAEVLRLSVGDRARLLDRLVASLDQDAEVEAAWDAEAERREDEIEAGVAKAFPFEEVISRLEGRFPG